MTADAAVVAGGTPIGDLEGEWPLCELAPLVARAARLGKPLAFIGTGTEPLSRRESRRTFAEHVARRAALWTVRSVHDRNRLIEYGVPPGAVTVTADVAWMLDAMPVDAARDYLARRMSPGGPLVGVNVNAERAVRAQQPKLVEHLAQFLDQIVETRGARIMFLCNEVRDGATFDLAVSREIIAAMEHGVSATVVPNEYWAPQFMMSLIGSCDFTVSTRYHFCVFSALQGIPFLAVKRAEKLSDLCDDLSWKHSVGLDELAPDVLAASFAGMESERALLVEHLRAGRLAMRERSLGNTLALEKLRDLLGKSAAS